ncbi:MAG: DUF2959 family protein, partial [Marinobacter sp.]
RASVFTQLTGLFCLVLALSGCSSMYYSTMEKFGVEKRDILVERVGDARDSQSDVRETFRSSLEQFQSVVGTPETTLQEKYEVISNAYDGSLNSSNKVQDRIEAVENVSEVLFNEWENEPDLYESASLRKTSKRRLDETRKLYSSLIT